MQFQARQDKRIVGYNGGTRLLWGARFISELHNLQLISGRESWRAQKKRPTSTAPSSQGAIFPTSWWLKELGWVMEAFAHGGQTSML